MPIYKTPDERASESVTVRLTIAERQMLGHLAELEGKTLTDFFRDLIAKRAAELNVTEPPPPMPRKRPGRPKKRPSASRSEAPWVTSAPPKEPAWTTSAPPPESYNAEPDSPDAPAAPPPKSEEASGTFDELIARFRDSFSHRADGTRRELEETLDFLMRPTDKPPIIPVHFPVSRLTSEKLQEIRRTIQESGQRLAKKNLHLTYLRMMLHFAVKESDFELRVNPARDLAPLTIVESGDNWLFFSGPSK